jgi:phosphoenolpyruvate carboxykinase (diphosphate)
MKLSLGFKGDVETGTGADERLELLRYLNLKLAANGLPVSKAAGGTELVSLAAGLITNFREKTRLLYNHRCPVDQRIESFLNSYFADVLAQEAADANRRGSGVPEKRVMPDTLRVPGRALVCDRHGLTRELSLPADGNEIQSEYLHSYRVRNGVLHNPRSDRRTTVGTFHVCEGGLTIPGDKRSVPKKTYVELFRHAMNPPADLLLLPFTANQEEKARYWVTVLLRPIVCPEVPGYCPEKTMEVRFFAPGALVSNLDFVESIFGNAGDPFVPMNDAALDIEHWSGHTGCVILAPHLTRLTKKQLGLPHISQATVRQRHDQMCWEHEGELYNGGEAFKITCRDETGVIVTIIADNYFGYCKKEVKTQISYAANLMGNVEEEHAGGALVFPSWSLGEELQVNSRRYNGRTFDDVVREYSQWIDVKPGGYGVDRNYANLIYIPEDARADLRQQDISWTRNGQLVSIPLLPGKVYMAPSGYKVRMEKHPSAPSWRIIGTAAEGTFCHKPCTVSGGGKSEISKSLVDYMQYGSVFVSDIEQDLNQVQQIFDRDFSDRWTAAMRETQDYGNYPSRPILSPKRSLGSVIKLLTPSEDYTDEYNAWLAEIPAHVYALVYAIKRFYNPAWGNDWRRHFNVDFVNGSPGHELKVHDRSIVGTYLRVGLTGNRGWRTFKVRQDFAAASKVQNEDDISASVVVPVAHLSHLADEGPAPNPTNVSPAESESDGTHSAVSSKKFVANCEYRLFQRPDDAVHRGFDKQAEADLAREGVNFISNFEPMSRADVEEMMAKVVDFDAFTPPVKKLLESVMKSDSQYIVCSDNPRRVGGVPSKNPRYLQDRPDIVKPIDRYVAEMGTRFWRKIPANLPVHLPVNAVLSGRRNNPPEKAKGIRSLAVYSPIHYQELPELFMDYICSLTGKSPSTTGAGSEGALTKGPFNAVIPTADINAALVSMILTDLPGYSTAAGHVGPNSRFDHDISLLVPEVWCRMSPYERDPKYLIQERLLEPVNDFTHNGERIPASRLGYRITDRFIRRYFGRVFDNPDKVFDKSILQPETQDLDSFADGIKYIVEAQQRSAQQYFDDGSIENACPPLKVLLTIMARGDYEGKTERDPEVRRMFTREALLASDWYHERLVTKQQRDIALWERHRDYLDTYLRERIHPEPGEIDEILSRQQVVAQELERLRHPNYLQELIGTLGAEPRM